MHRDLKKARENLRSKLLQNAEAVLQEVLNAEMDDLIEIGLFGSVVKDKFTCSSDTDIYLLFENEIPDRRVKGGLRSIAEENNCDIVFLTMNDFNEEAPDLLVKNILEGRIVLWRRGRDDTK
ncbi:nucleotidyltransferase domain-containing protein [Sedimentibacter hydroxybenzoicus DSM 7310]|uniref:Nucleotidyltransferase domain-containing protein n=1 Tax=Sedimentibacter hydroxybenzoicus DSM 7310 TaxID=1123245 RepID=A0A974GV46_SEDHY|nr:nucleotidyltransferase domain-containing protein [Sedimentibacter hydroxybenzoicus]NYB72981.1 nucleotidyltransferase domain-containing protein [Sedimentibacter hydroxybenzoicus DSM 7310]